MAHDPLQEDILLDRFSEEPTDDIWDSEPLDEGGYAENDEGEDASGTGEVVAEPSEFDVVAEELEAVADGKAEPNHKIVKGLQRVVARKDREIAELRQGMSQLAARMEERFALHEDAIYAVDASGKLTYELLEGNLEEDPRKDAQIAAMRRQEEIRQAGQRRQQERAQRVQPAQQQSQQMPDWQAEMTRRVAAERAAMLTELKDIVTDYGVDPNNKELDFGSDDETFTVRLAKTKNSVRAIRRKSDEEAVASVRGTPVNTRGATGGSIPTPTSGQSLLQQGAAARLKMMRQASQ